MGFRMVGADLISVLTTKIFWKVLLESLHLVPLIAGLSDRGKVKTDIDELVAAARRSYPVPANDQPCFKMQLHLRCT